MIVEAFAREGRLIVGQGGCCLGCAMMDEGKVEAECTRRHKTLTGKVADTQCSDGAATSADTSSVTAATVLLAQWGWGWGAGALSVVTPAAARLVREAVISLSNSTVGAVLRRRSVNV